MVHVLCVFLLVAPASDGIGPDQPSFQGKPIGHWVGKLSDPDPNVRNLAAYALGEIGPKAEQAVPVLIDAYENGRSDLRLSVIEALGSIGPDAKESMPLLFEALADEKLGSHAATAIVKIAPDAARKLAQAAGRVNPSNEVGLAGGAVFFAAGGRGVVQFVQPNGAVPRIVAAPPVMAAAQIRALQPLPAPAPKQAQARPRRARRRRLAQGVAKAIAVPAPVPVPARTKAAGAVRAAQVVAKPKEVNGELLILLRTALKDKDAKVRSLAAVSLGLLGPGAKVAVSDLTTALRDEDPTVRRHALGALKRIDPTAIFE